MHRNTKLLLISIVASLASVTCIFTPVVEISQGKVRGLRSVSGQNRFYGIPYAVSERFQPPQEPPKWQGVLTAVSRLGHCAQAVAWVTLGREDCLELDVYVPEHAATPRPVLVFLHGGGYYYGTKAHYDPEFLVVKDVVVVIVNYRVGVLGFLCVNGVANLGLKDQVAALKWIQKNIAAFGGDPDNVTISGQSAGASAAAMHFLSTASKGLFHKAILMSGTPITPWAYNVEPLRPALQDARRLNPAATEADIYNTFAKASLEDLLDTCRDVSSNTRYFKYSPCVDSNLTDPFFHDTPYNIIKSGNFNKVPMIVGYTNVEGMLFYGLNNDDTFKEWDENFVEHLPTVFSWQTDEVRVNLAEKIRSHYFGKKRINRAAVKEVVSYYSDWMAYSSVDAFAGLMEEYSGQPVYSYVFGYEGGRNFAKLLFGSATGLPGASHSDDIFYVFKPAGLSLLLSGPDRLFIDRFTAMLTNFMKFGDPTPRKSKLLPFRWDPRGNSSRALRLTRRPRMVGTPSSRGRFLLAVLCTYGLRGYVPCETPSTQ